MERGIPTYTGEHRRAEYQGIPEPELEAPSLGAQAREVAVFSVMYALRRGRWPSRRDISLAFAVPMSTVDHLQEVLNEQGIRIVFMEDE